MDSISGLFSKKKKKKTSSEMQKENQCTNLKVSQEQGKQLLSSKSCHTPYGTVL